ncbi:MAG: hypothetical protein KGK10_02005 [Rhodospirillales bacterium]|nr:hypothetical protein [Rhodospirillales bacterium]
MEHFFATGQKKNMTALCITFRDALEAGRFRKFIIQEVARLAGLCRATTAEMLDKAIEAGVKLPQSADRTSGSPSTDGSRGKRTR